MCFKSRADKDAFLTAARLIAVGDKYLDDYAVARTLGIPIPTNEDKERCPIRTRLARAAAAIRRTFSRRVSSPSRDRSSGT